MRLDDEGGMVIRPGTVTYKSQGPYLAAFPV